MKTLTEKRFFEWHEDDVSVSLRARSGSYSGGSEVLVVSYQKAANDVYVTQAFWDGSQTAGTLTANNAGGGQRMPDKDNFHGIVEAYSIENHPNDSRIKIRDDDTVQTLSGRMGTGENNTPMCMQANSCETQYAVRRLTPEECEILQGYPIGYTNIGDWVDSNGKVRKTTDSARYKALGNSICLPPWKWVLKRICATYERDATMGSLFDGIGGFPLIWEQLNYPGSCLWASEIEEFPIAVTERKINGTRNYPSESNNRGVEP